MNVAVVGCGLMGGSLAKALLMNGHNVTLVDSNEKVLEKFVKGSVQYSPSLDNVKNIEVIVFNLPNNSITKTILSNLKTDIIADKFVINTTTSTPNEVIELEKIITSKGGSFLDCKIEVYPEDVGPEHGYLIYSGNENVFNATLPVLKSWSENPDYLGSTVAAASIIDDSVIAELHIAVYVAMLDAIALSAKHGFPMEKLFEMIDQIWGFNGATARHLKETFLNGIPEELPDASGAFLSTEKIGLTVARNAIAECGNNTALCDSLLTLFSQAVEAGYGSKEMAALINVIHQTK